MFTLYMKSDARYELAPKDIQFILSPDTAMEMACIFYEMDYLKYTTRIIPHHVPQRKYGVYHRFAAQPYKRKYITEYDKIYDDVKWQLEHGWMVGVDTTEKWDRFRNPFYFDEDSSLIYDCFMDHYGERFQIEVRDIYEYILNEHQGNKPAPTIKQHYADTPIQHAQSTKTINSKAAGRLLAGGGIYNGNIEGFHQTAEQLGGDAPAGYEQIMNEQTKGLLIAGVSVAAGLTMGGLGAVNELSEISHLSKIPDFDSPAITGFISETGVLINAEHAVIDPKKLASYALNPNHPVGGNKAKVFESALGYNPSNSDVLVSKVQQGILSSPAEIGLNDTFGQRMSVDMPIIGANGESATIRTGWMYETDSVVPRMTTIYVK